MLLPAGFGARLAGALTAAGFATRSGGALPPAGFGARSGGELPFAGFGARSGGALPPAGFGARSGGELPFAGFFAAFLVMRCAQALPRTYEDAGASRYSPRRARRARRAQSPELPRPRAYSYGIVARSDPLRPEAQFADASKLGGLSHPPGLASIPVGFSPTSSERRTKRPASVIRICRMTWRSQKTEGRESAFDPPM